MLPVVVLAYPRCDMGNSNDPNSGACVKNELTLERCGLVRLYDLTERCGSRLMLSGVEWGYVDNIDGHLPLPLRMYGISHLGLQATVLTWFKSGYIGLANSVRPGMLTTTEGALCQQKTTTYVMSIRMYR
jgi:hypothetical protein